MGAELAAVAHVLDERRAIKGEILFLEVTGRGEEARELVEWAAQCEPAEERTIYANGTSIRALSENEARWVEHQRFGCARRLSLFEMTAALPSLGLAMCHSALSCDGADARLAARLVARLHDSSSPFARLPVSYRLWRF